MFQFGDIVEYIQHTYPGFDANLVGKRGVVLDGQICRNRESNHLLWLNEEGTAFKSLAPTFFHDLRLKKVGVWFPASPVEAVEDIVQRKI